MVNHSPIRLIVHFIRAYLCRTTSRNVALGNRLPYNYILTSKIDRTICKIRRKHDKFYLISIFSPIFGQKIPSVIFRTEGYFPYISRLIYSGEVCIFLKRRGYCAGVSLMTGSSWTTIATIGVALMGTGQAMGFPEGWIAGAIISGAYFGDKLSLLSDTTVLASSTVGVPIFTHIRYMLYTTVPSFVIALAVFVIAGLTLDHTGGTHAGMYAESLRGTFRITPWLLAVPVATGVLIVRKLPAIVTLFCAAVFACIAMLLAQPELVAKVAGVGGLDFMSGFKGVLMSCFGPTAIPTGSPQLDELVATRGMAGMLNTVWLIICAMCFGGVMTGSGMLGALTSVFLRFVRRAFSAVASTVGAGIFFNLCTADQYISIILSGRLFRELYAERGLEPRLLSRSVEDSATVCSVLVPWNSCGMTQATVLGVSTFVYMPYCIFNIVSPLMSLMVAAIGWKIKRAAGTAAHPH